MPTVRAGLSTAVTALLTAFEVHHHWGAVHRAVAGDWMGAVESVEAEEGGGLRGRVCVGGR